MPQEPPSKPDSKIVALMGDSEEFVLPKAPPVPRPNTSRSAPSQLEDQWLPPAGEVAGDDAPVPGMPATLQTHPQKRSLHQVNESTEQQVQSEDFPHAEAWNRDAKEAVTIKPHDSASGRKELIVVIVILLLVIVGLLIVLPGGESPQQTTTRPVVSPPGENEAMVNELRSENQTMRGQLAEMTAQTKQTKEQLETLRNARDKAVSDLGRANDASGRELADLRAEVTRLETLVRNSRPPQEATSTVHESLPEPQVVGTVYRVSGLPEGDTLNVRSGPGSGFSVVTQLHLGVRVTVTGSAVANGNDWWLPCYLSGKVVDPATGASKPWTAKGWINSAFLEEDG